MKVYTLRYAHKHGTDVMVFGDGSLADNAAEEIIREYIDDFAEKSEDGDEAKAKILELLDSSDKVSEAIDAYGELTSGYETIEIEEAELALGKDPLVLDREALRLGKYTKGYDKLTPEQLHGLLWLLGEWACRAHPDGGVTGCHTRAIEALAALRGFTHKPLTLDEAQQLMRDAARKPRP
jgi:hypothetical protein